MHLSDSITQHGNTAVFGEFYGYAMNDSTLFLAMEYFHHGDLKKHIEVRAVNEQEAKKIVYDILVGLKTIHAEGIVHRDLKPEVRYYPFVCWLVE
jgi:serine/threonine protein kinase